MIIYFVPKNSTWGDLISSLDSDPDPDPRLAISLFSVFRSVFPGRVYRSYYDSVVSDHHIDLIFSGKGTVERT